MKPKHIFYSGLIFACLVSFLIRPVARVHSETPKQDQVTIYASGSYCDDYRAICGPLNFSFNPSGGSINGSFKGTKNNDAYGVLHVSGNLSGTFTGGDGGHINGRISSVKWWWTSKATGNAISSPENFSAGEMQNWKGTLYSSGNGNGTIGEGGSWTVTFSSEGFVAALPTATQEILPTTTGAILPTPTSFEAVGKEFNLLPETKEFISSSPSVNEATKTIFKQDAAIIVRDENNQFYAIDNNGKSVALPAALNSYFRMSNQFAVLGNDKWLASSEYGSIRASINGGGDFVQLDKMPDDMKDRDYTMLATNCSNSSECNPVMKINSTASSTKIVGSCLLNSTEPSQTGMIQSNIYYVSSERGRVESSEHGSCRGTINGGGDFIFQPNPVILAAYDLQPNENSAPPGFLGVLVEDKSDGAEIMQIQAGSPAELAGLEIGDLVTEVSGTPLDGQQTLYLVLGQFSGGDEIILKIARSGQISTINLTLAAMASPVIETPSAEITISDKTELVVDIGFNGITGVLVLADFAHVVEPITGTSVDVPAGSAVIVVPGEPLETAYTMVDSDVNKWWETPPESSTTPPTGTTTSDTQTGVTYKGYKDFNPFPGANEQNLYWIFCFFLAVLYVIVLLILLFKKRN